MKDEEAREGEQEEQLPAEDMCMNSWMEVATKYIELIKIIGASDVDTCCSAGAGGLDARGGTKAGAGAGLAPSTCAKMSSFNTRPSFPDPLTSPRLTPYS